MSRKVTCLLCVLFTALTLQLAQAEEYPPFYLYDFHGYDSHEDVARLNALHLGSVVFHDWWRLARLGNLPAMALTSSAASYSQTGSYGMYSYDMPPERPMRSPLYVSYSGSYIADDFNTVGGIQGLDGGTDTFRQALRFYNPGSDRFSYVATLTYDTVSVHSAAGTDLDRYDFRFSPFYGLLEQETDGVDLDLIGTLGVYTVNFESGAPVDDADYLYTGAGLGLGKTTGVGDFRLSYVYSIDNNIDGDQGITGKTNFNMHNVSLGYSVPLTDALSAGLGVDYVHMCDLPDTYSSNEYNGNLYVAYDLDRWGIEAKGSHSLSDNNQTQSSVGAEIYYTW